jgi:hypothetical protein
MGLEATFYSPVSGLLLLEHVLLTAVLAATVLAATALAALLHVLNLRADLLVTCHG